MIKNHKTQYQFTVIGGGILGLTCAYTLSEKFGQNSVQIIDLADFPVHNASYIAGGMIAPYSELDHLPHRFITAGLHGIEYWKNFQAQTSHDFEFHENGSLILAHGDDRHLLERFRSNLPRNEHWKTCEHGEIIQAEPALAHAKFTLGLSMNTEAHLHPQKLMQALCDALPHKSIRRTIPEAEANISEWVIDCRGMGASPEDQDLRGVKGETLIIRNPDFKISRPIRLMHPRYPLYIVPRAGNIFMIGATIIESNHSTHTSLRSGLELMSALFSLHPSFAEAEILELKAGIRPAYPDNLPHITIDKNIIHCNGLYRHGYLLSPAISQCVLALVSNEKCDFMNLFLKDKCNGHYTEWKTNRA